MNKPAPTRLTRLLGLAAGACWTAAGLAAAELPPPAAGPVDFERDIRPIFETHCLKCHGPERARSGFRLDSRERALGGGDNNDRNILPGDSAGSPLIRYVAGLEPDMLMPPPSQNDRLSPEEIGLLRRWIDDGAPWTAASLGPARAARYEVEPVVGWIGLSGDSSRFRQQQTRETGWFGGLRHFEVFQPLGSDASLSLDGHTLAGPEDHRVRFELRQTELGFVRGGFETARRWQGRWGGWHAPFGETAPPLSRDPVLDTGRAWIEAGLERAHLPRIVAGYEHRFRDGVANTLQWGQWTPDPAATPKAVRPNERNLRERVHRVTLDVSHEMAGYSLENAFEAEFFQLETRRRNAGSGGPDVVETHAQKDTHTRLSNAFHLEKPWRSWLLASAGYLYAHLDGQAAFGQTFELPGLGSFAGLHSRRIALDQETHVANANLRLGPWGKTTLSLGLQADRTTQDGVALLGEPGFPDETALTYDTGLDRLALDERLALRSEFLPATILHTEVRLRQEWLDYRETGRVEDGFPDQRDFLRDTDERADLRDLHAGATVSPWAGWSFQPWYRRFERDRRFRHAIDEDGAQPPFAVSGAGYPAFLRRLEREGDEAGGRLVTRWNRWLRTSLRVAWSEERTANEVPDTLAPGFPGPILLPGGTLLAGRSEQTSVGLDLRLTPWRRWRFGLNGTWRDSTLRTLVTPNGPLAPYEGDGLDLRGEVAWLVDEKTEIRLAYGFGTADYAAANPAGLPLGIRYEQHAVEAGLQRRLSERATWSLEYAFFSWREPSLGGLGNYRAHALVTSLRLRLR